MSRELKSVVSQPTALHGIQSRVRVLPAALRWADPPYKEPHRKSSDFSNTIRRTINSNAYGAPFF
jgi:hypothetical protein